MCRAWQVVVKAATGSVPLLADSGRNAGAPFIAPLQAFRHNLAHVHLHQFEQYDLWFLELAILVCFSVAGPDGTITRSANLPGGRFDVRDRSTTMAMHLVRRLLLGEGD